LLATSFLPCGDLPGRCALPSFDLPCVDATV
jgi:hypothetical protein